MGSSLALNWVSSKDYYKSHLVHRLSHASDILSML